MTLKLIPCHPAPRLQTSPVAARADRIMTPEAYALIAKILAASKQKKDDGK